MSVQGARVPLVRHFGGRWQLTWMHAVSDTLGHEVLAYASSENGSEWSTPLFGQDHREVTLFQSFTLDECGDVYVVLSQMARDGLLLREVRVTADRISERRFLPGSSIAFAPALVGANSKTGMLWSANTGADQPVVLQYASRRACGCSKQ